MEFRLRPLGFIEFFCNNNQAVKKMKMEYIYLIYIYHLLILLLYIVIDLVGRVFANGPGDQGLVPGHVIPKT